MDIRIINPSTKEELIFSSETFVLIKDNDMNDGVAISISKLYNAAINFGLPPTKYK